MAPGDPRRGWARKLLRLDWDIIAGITAALLAIVLHLLHLADPEVLLTIVLVLLALLLFRDLRREHHDERLLETARRNRAGVQDILAAIEPSEAILIGPRRLRAESRRFAEAARGEMVWFNMCFAMFRSPEVFDLMLRPAIENPKVESIRFIAGHGERERWDRHMAPKIRECRGREKVSEPLWRDLPETVSFILADTGPTDAAEALLSFWGEPFMSRATGRQVPRYTFRISARSELVSRLAELERQYRIADS